MLWIVAGTRKKVKNARKMVFDPAFVHNLLRLIIWQKAQQSQTPASQRRV